jgi:hypothetical protein
MVTLLFRSYAACILGLSGYFSTKILRLRRIYKLEGLFFPSTKILRLCPIYKFNKLIVSGFRLASTMKGDGNPDQPS